MIVYIFSVFLVIMWKKTRIMEREKKQYILKYFWVKDIVFFTIEYNFSLSHDYSKNCFSQENRFEVLFTNL